MARNVASPLAALFVSNAIPQIIAALSLHGSATAGELTERVSVGSRAVHYELNRLRNLGILTITRVHRVQVYTLTTDPLVHHLVSISLLAYGPLHIIGQNLGNVQGIEQAFIFGSWARRYHGEIGRIPNDIDVYAVGDTSRNDISEASEFSSDRLGRPVNTRRVTTEEWNNPVDPFLKLIREQPLVEIELQLPK